MHTGRNGWYVIAAFEHCNDLVIDHQSGLKTEIISFRLV